jgi:hypothetical protein
MKKAIWRLIIGVVLLAGVASTLRNFPTGEHDPVYVYTYFGLDVLFAAIGVWLVVSYLRRSN